jgi:hypothetical protein
MRAFFVICLGCLCTAAFGSQTGAAPAADAAKADCGKPAATSGPATLSVKQVQTVLCCIDSILKANLQVKIKFMKVLPQAKDVFDKDYWPPGTAFDVKTATDWDKVGGPIAKALKDTPPVTAGFTPGFALRADVPLGSKCQCLPGQYVLLMSCTTKAGQLYFNDQLVGWFWMDDITTTLNAVFPAPATAANTTAPNSTAAN